MRQPKSIKTSYKPHARHDTYTQKTATPRSRHVQRPWFSNRTRIINNKLWYQKAVKVEAEEEKKK
jgi:hypothetical protein